MNASTGVDIQASSGTHFDFGAALKRASIALHSLQCRLKTNAWT
jgi:hypothetical protein